MTLTQQRKGEIALAILKEVLRNDGLHLSARQLGEKAKKAVSIGVSEGEYRQFVELMAREYLEETFGKK